MTAAAPRESGAWGSALRTLRQPTIARAGSERHTTAKRVMLRGQRRSSFTFPNPIKAQQEAAKNTILREEIKSQRYERMMDHFQLRRVLSPAASSRSLTATTARAATARLNNTARPHGSAAPSGSTLSTQRNPSGQLLGPPLPHEEGQAVKPSFGAPFSPTGCVVAGRLVVLSATMAILVLYLPFTLAHGAQHDVDIAYQCMRIASDVTFVLSVFVVANTCSYTSRGQLVTTRRAIWRQYRQRGLASDLLACLPLSSAFQHPAWAHSVLSLVQLVGRLLLVRRQYLAFRDLHLKATAGTGKGFFGWMMYSRYSHLVRVACIVAYIILLAHYLACVWAWLNAGFSLNLPHKYGASGSIAHHIHNIYDVIQLLQGQGVGTRTVAQDVFASVTVLLGSIALAVVFGHVAILVANFSANDTSYQRKMESVFAVMTKLQLPHPIRERVHQYYEYLHAEYESLDGEVVRFAKDLSHTLELEVVLFKYMDVVMHVPHWRECSPDFQKQLVLHLSVRVYLPDDFIMRRGEVGTECYIINRGTCKLCEYTTGDYVEHPTEALPPEQVVASRGSLQLKSSSRVGTSREAEPSSEPAVFTLGRGQAVGVFALLANYERPCDLRAMGYVEMCIIERTAFQKILTRYPRDREVTLANIIGHNIRQTEARGLPSTLMDMVRVAAPYADTARGIDMLVQAMNPPLPDPTLRFGATDRLADELRQLIARRQDPSPSATHETCQCEASIRLLLQQADRILRRMEAPTQSIQLPVTAKVDVPHGDPHVPRAGRKTRTQSYASVVTRVRRTFRRTPTKHTMDASSSAHLMHTPACSSRQHPGAMSLHGVEAIARMPHVCCHSHPAEQNHQNLDLLDSTCIHIRY